MSSFYGKHQIFFTNLLLEQSIIASWPVSPTDTECATLKYLHSGQQGSMGISWPSFLPNWLVALQQVNSKVVKKVQLTERVCYDCRHCMWMTRHGKCWPQEIRPRVLGCKDNLYAYKSITELVSTQEKITWLGVYINEVHCNSIYFLLLKYFTNVLLCE